MLPWVGLVESSSLKLLKGSSSVVKLCREPTTRGDAVRFEVRHDRGYLRRILKGAASDMSSRDRQHTGMVKQVARGELRTLDLLARLCGVD